MKNIKRKTTMLLLAFCVISLTLVAPTQTDFTPVDDGSFTLSVEARLVNGEMLIESHFDGSDRLTASVAADFTPNDEFVLSDGYDYNNDDASGLSGTFAITVTGYYKTGQNYYWTEKHTSWFSLTFGHGYYDLEVEHISEDYYYKVYTIGTSWYYAHVDNYAQTRMNMEITFWGIHIGDVSLDCLVSPS